MLGHRHIPVRFVDINARIPLLLFRRFRPAAGDYAARIAAS
jgi:hypothetical protein